MYLILPVIYYILIIKNIFLKKQIKRLIITVYLTIILIKRENSNFFTINLAFKKHTIALQSSVESGYTAYLTQIDCVMLYTIGMLIN